MPPPLPFSLASSWRLDALVQGPDQHGIAELRLEEVGGVGLRHAGLADVGRELRRRLLHLRGEDAHLLADLVVLDRDAEARRLALLQPVRHHALDRGVARCRLVQGAQQLHPLLDVGRGDRLAVGRGDDRLRRGLARRQQDGQDQARDENGERRRLRQARRLRTGVLRTRAQRQTMTVHSGPPHRRGDAPRLRPFSGGTRRAPPRLRARRRPCRRIDAAASTREDARRRPIRRSTSPSRSSGRRHRSRYPPRRRPSSRRARCRCCCPTCRPS